MKSIVMEQSLNEHLSALSMVCFLEELEPEALLLAAEVHKEVRAGLESLAQKPVLDAMLACLEELSGGA